MMVGLMVYVSFWGMMSAFPYEILWTAQNVEREIDAWSPRKTYIRPAGRAESDFTLISGTWKTRVRMESTMLTFEPMDRGVYKVTFSTAGCLSRWASSRTATVADGAVQLNRAVQTYDGLIFDRLFLLHRNGHLELVPAGGIERQIDLDVLSPVEIDFGVGLDSFARWPQQQAGPPNTGKQAR